MRKRKDLEKMAHNREWILNPDDKVVNAILKRQNIRYEKEGDYYYLCKPPAISENICNPCVNSQKEVEEDGHCHCNLFHDPRWQNGFLKV